MTHAQSSQSSNINNNSASSHMLVSNIKPCMFKYKPVHGETVNGSLNQLWFLRSLPSMDNCNNSRANTCTKAPILQEKSTELSAQLFLLYICFKRKLLFNK